MMNYPAKSLDILTTNLNTLYVFNFLDTSTKFFFLYTEFLQVITHYNPSVWRRCHKTSLRTTISFRSWKYPTIATTGKQTAAKSVNLIKLSITIITIFTIYLEKISRGSFGGHIIRRAGLSKVHHVIGR